jgi:hypothetical protein
MKKVVLSILLLTLSKTSFTLPVLNPVDPALVTTSTILDCCNGTFGLKFGFRSDILTHANIVDDTGNRSKRRVSYSANEGVLTLNIARCVDVYGFCGAMSIYQKPVKRDFTEPTPRKVLVMAKSKTTEVWGGGIKAIIWEGKVAQYGRGYVTYDLAYQYTGQTPFDYLAVSSRIVDSFDSTYSLHSWQTSLTYGQKLKNFIPYFSFRWMGLRLNPEGARQGGSGPTRIRFHSVKLLKNAGLAFGVAYMDNCRMSITAEARFVGETGYSIGANLKF